MRVFHCDVCAQTLYFENSDCIKCGHTLAYLPELGAMTALAPAASEGRWQVLCATWQGGEVRLCENYVGPGVCNWAVPDTDPESLCQSCRLTRVLPDLDVPGNRQAWAKLETAKRRLVFTLLDLGLPLDGLEYRFMADQVHAPGSILTGHDNGIITINIAEADDLERERRRLALHEPYRTVLGHLRHEVGHYYWDRLIRDAGLEAAFRKCFGDERQDYAAALQRHYDQGPPVGWQDEHVSAYASTHPWEDWAESWAHYLHMITALDTAAHCGLGVQPHRDDEPRLTLDAAEPQHRRSFDRLIADWLALTYVLNNLDRSLGLSDSYPFVLAQPVIRKLRFIHEHLPRAD